MNKEQLCHDIRGQLTSLYANIDLLTKTELMPDQAQLVFALKQAMGKISRLVGSDDDMAVTSLAPDSAVLGLLQNKSALILEDEALSRAALAGMLNSWGILCESFERPENAKMSLQTKVYDFIIVDYFQNNSKEDGLEFILSIKKDTYCKVDNSVIVLISGSNSALEFSRASVDLCFAKPIISDLFLQQLVSAFKAKTSKNQFVDHERILQYQNSQLLIRLFSIFEVDVPLQILNLQEAIQNRDLQKAKYFIHCLISKAKTMGATRMSQLCIGVEVEIEAIDEQWDKLLENISQIEQCYIETVSYIKKNFELS